MSQPYHRNAKVAAPGKLDKQLGEFWVDNPWEIVAKGYNLSCFERNRVFLNVQGKEFLDISHLTSADNDGDSRAAVSADFRNNGRQDLVLRQVGGGALVIYENNIPQGHYLTVTLRGLGPNRLGIGSRMVAQLGSRKVVRELYPVNSFRSQMPSLTHFGLGDAAQIDRLTITWPNGDVQELTDIEGDRHVVIEQSQPPEAAIETVTPGETIRP